MYTKIEIYTKNNAYYKSYDIKNNNKLTFSLHYFNKNMLDQFSYCTDFTGLFFYKCTFFYKRFLKTKKLYHDLIFEMKY